jgi:hypothetical protein
MAFLQGMWGLVAPLRIDATVPAPTAVLSALGELRFSLVAGSNTRSCGSVRYRVTKETGGHLNTLMQDAARIAID